MAISCPNKKLSAWKNLEKAVGTPTAFALWAQFDGVVPESYYAKSNKSAIKFVEKSIGFKSKGFGDNFSKIKDKLKQFNTKYKTAHTLTRGENIGESLQFNFILNEDWNGVDPSSLVATQIKGSTKNTDSGSKKYFQIQNKPTAEKIDALDIKLKQLLSNLGVSVEQYDQFKKDHGVDAIAMFEIVNGVAKIKVDFSNANELTLPEETAHFIIETMGDSVLGKRMLELMRANDYYKYVLGENYDAYYEAYDGDEIKLIKEAAGQVLSQAIVSKFKQDNLNIPDGLLGIITRFWNYVRELYKRISQTELNKAINDVYGNVANEFMQGNSSFINAITLPTDIRLFQISDSALNGLKTSIEKARDASAKRLNVYKKKDIKRTAAIEEASLKQLEEHLEKQQYMLAALSVSEHARRMFTHVTKRIGELKKSIENLDVVGQDALLSLASTLRDMKSFSDSYLPMAKEIQSEVNDILDEEPDNADYKKIDEIISEVVKQAEKLDRRYLEMARPLWAKYLVPFLYSGPITEENLLESLSEGGKDITFVQRFVDSMASSGMPILQILDVAVKDAKGEARDESYNSIKELIQARMDLEKSGIKDTKWLYEIKKDGSLSGNNVYEYNYGDWQDAREAEGKKILATIRSANKNIELAVDDRDLLDQIAGNDILSAQYKRMWSYWFRNNSKEDPNAADIIADKKAHLGEDEFNDWYDENTVTTPEGAVYYIKELSIPANKYKNPQYSEIQSNPAKKKYYDLWSILKDEHDQKLPANQRLGRLAPQSRTDFIEKIKRSQSLGEAGRNVKASFQETFQNVEDDTDIGSKFKVTDENGKIVYFLPIHFTGKLKDMRDLSTDSTESLAAFISTTNDYSKMSKIIDILELGRDVISNVQLQEFDSNGNVIKESINILGKKVAKNLKIDPKTSNMKARLDDYFKMNIYGHTRVEGKDFNILGYKVNSEKLWDALGKYTSLNNLALNIYAGIQNPLIGNANIRIESISKQFFGQKALAKADVLYWSKLPQNLANLGARNATDFISLWREKMETMQDFSREMKELNMDRTNLVQKLSSTNSLYVTSSSGEHYMQLRSSFALAYETKLKDLSGKEITLLDAFDVVNNKMVLKKGLTTVDGKPFTEINLRAWKRKQNAINNSLHGIYNDQDLLAIQQYGMLRQVLMFRKFMRPGINRRFRSKMYDYEKQAFIEGYYRTFGRFTADLVRGLKRGQFLLTANWDKLSPMERQNMLRSFADIGYMVATNVFIWTILPLLGADDEDDWKAQMISYQANRFLVEISFFYDPRQMVTLVKSPMAGIQSVNGIINFIATAANPWTAFDVIERGKWKSHTRLYKSAVGVFPMVKTTNDWLFPSDKLVYIKLNNK